MAHRRHGYRFENDSPLEKMRKATEESYGKAVIIPVNTEIEVDHRVLSYDSVKQYLLDASKLVLLDCGCRTKRGNCDGPIHVCIGVNERAEYLLTSEASMNPHVVDIDEALTALKKSHEGGLLHMALTRRDNKRPDAVDLICSCCTCCCIILSGIVRYGLAPHLLMSDTTSVTDMSKCTSCGVCVDRCQFSAREIVDGSLVFMSKLCFGCGLCASECPENAIKIVEK